MTGARALPWRRGRGRGDVGSADLLAVRAALTAGAAPAAALGETTAAALRADRAAVRTGRSLADLAQSSPDARPPGAAALVRALAVADLVGAPATSAVQAVLDGIGRQTRLQAQVRVRSADAVTSARFITALPVGGALLLSATSGEVRAVLLSGTGAVLVTLAGVLVAVAAAWMRRLLRGVDRAARRVDPLAPADGATDDGAAVPTAEALDLLALATAAGTGLAPALQLVARLGPPTARPALAAAARRLASGLPPAQAFDDRLAELGAVVDVTHRWGAPIAEALRLLAADLRDRAATAAEEAAERLSVHLIFPTTVLLVPAFALLAVAPVVLATLRGALADL